jgi:hypothetical protein
VPNGNSDSRELSFEARGVNAANEHDQDMEDWQLREHLMLDHGRHLGTLVLQRLMSSHAKAHADRIEIEERTRP